MSLPPFDFEPLVKLQFADNANLATEVELKQQARIALAEFAEADNGDGELNFGELKRLCGHLGLPLEQDEDEAMMKMDADGDGSLNVEEWLAWWLRRVGQSPNPAKQMEVLAKNTLKKFDKDNSKSIDKEEFKDLIVTLGAEFTENEIAEALITLDSDNSGAIEMKEFVSWWSDRASQTRKMGSIIALKLRKLASKALVTFHTDIFTAAWKGDIELLESFLEDKRLANSMDSSEFGDNWSPLHYAAYHGHERIAEKLLEAGAKVDKQTSLGFTPLFYAAQRENIQMVKLFLDQGADPGIHGRPHDNDNIWLCPADMAIDNDELLQIFKKNPKCAPPSPVDQNKISFKLDVNNNTLAMDLPQNIIRAVCALPIKKWTLELSQDRTSTDIKATKMNTPKPLKVHVSAHATGQGYRNQYVIPLDKEWLRTCKDEGFVYLQIAATNALGETGSSSEKNACKIPYKRAIVMSREKAESKENANNNDNNEKNNEKNKDKAKEEKERKGESKDIDQGKIKTNKKGEGKQRNIQHKETIEDSNAVEFSFEQMIAADSDKNKKGLAPIAAQVEEGSFSFEQMIAADSDKSKQLAPMAPAAAGGGAKFSRGRRVS